MTYLGVLLIFIVPPLIILSLAVPTELWRWVLRRGLKPDLRIYKILLAHVVLALAYTTPWDNYLVANGVWWYAPDQVLGITLGWVPLEEYGFFILQTLLTGLWTIGLLRMRSLSPQPLIDRPSLRRISSLVVLLLWAMMLVLWSTGWAPGTYMILILVWALPPVLIQMAFGADILRQNWRILAPAVSLPTIYLWVVDALAIGSGTWTIDPDQTTGLLLGNLPFEEMLFFFITNLMVGFGIVLMASADSQRRAAALLKKIREIIRTGSITSMDWGKETE